MVKQLLALSCLSHLSARPLGITRLPRDGSSLNFILFLRKSINHTKVWLESGANFYFVLLVWEPPEVIKCLRPKILLSAIQFQHSPYLVFTVSLNLFFTPSRRQSAAMFIPHCNLSSSSSSSSFFMALRPVFWPWPPRCRRFQTVEFVRGKHVNPRSLQHNHSLSKSDIFSFERD